MNPPRFKHASTYADDTAWCAKRLAEGYRVWCARWLKTGLVTSYVATEDDIATWEALNGEPVASFAVHAVYRSAATGNVSFGPECPWPMEGNVCERLTDSRGAQKEEGK